MNYIDVIILILVFFAAYKGFTRGLIKELISFLSLIIGVYISINFSVYIEKILVENFPKIEGFVTITSFILVFLVVVFSLKLAGTIINKIAKSLQLGLLNKILGLLFGALKSILIISLILFQIQHLEKNLEINLLKSQKEKSVFYTPLSKEIIPKILIVKEKLVYESQQNP